jgi:hypothetical protein
MIKLLLADQRVDPACDDDVLLRVAASEEHFSVVMLLLAVWRQCIAIGRSCIGNGAPIS